MASGMNIEEFLPPRLNYYRRQARLWLAFALVNAFWLGFLVYIIIAYPIVHG